MGLNPSCNNVEGKPLPVLGDPPFSAEHAEIAMNELLRFIPIADLRFKNTTSMHKIFKKGSKGHAMGRCGISCYYEGQENDVEDVELVRVEAEAYNWTFYRAWYYWVCGTRHNPISEKAAKELNDAMGGQVRVNGFAGGTSVDGVVDSYHVDTLDGLKALLEMIRDEQEDLR
jgi:hypothetical protein